MSDPSAVAVAVPLAAKKEPFNIPVFGWGLHLAGDIADLRALMRVPPLPAWIAV